MQSTVSRNSASPAQHANLRDKVSTPLRLIEVERSSVVDAIRPQDGQLTDTVYAMGTMRELCPHCRTTHLKLVLRQKRVRHAHLYCEQCNKCFDARYLDGAPALEMHG
jgi:hypothetical protein